MILSLWVKNLIRKKLDLVKQKGFYSYKYMTDFEKFKENYQAKQRKILQFVNR